MSTHTRDHRLQTSLFKACSQGNIEMLNYLLRKDVGFTQSRARLISLDCDCMFQSNFKNVRGVSGVVASMSHPITHTIYSVRNVVKLCQTSINY